MTIITLETETTFNIRTSSWMVENIDWLKILKTLNHDAKYSIRVINK